MNASLAGLEWEPVRGESSTLTEKIQTIEREIGGHGCTL